MNLKILLSTVLFIMGSCHSQAAAKLQQNDSIPLDPGVRYGKLKNGFTYYLRKTGSGEKVVRFDLVVKAGWDHEDSDQLEYAHLVEHLLAKETLHFPNLKTHFYNAGRKRHAFTESRRTQYFATIPRNDENVFNDGLQVLYDWASRNSAWTPESIAVERGAIEGEMRTNDPYRDWKKRSMEGEVLKKMGYQAHDPEKSLSNIKYFDVQAFYHFYKDWYRPDLQAAIIVGDINVDSLEGAIKERFGGLKGPNNPPNPKKYLDAQTVHFDEKVHYTTINDSLESEIQLEVLRVRPNYEFSPKTRADYRKMLMQQLYMVLLDKRAKQAEQQYDPPFSYFSANYRYGVMAGGQINATQMSLTLESDDLEKLKVQFKRGIQAWKQLHLEITPTEIKDSKKQIRSNNSNQRVRAKELAEKYQDHFVHGKAAPNPEVEAKLINDLLKEISVGELQTFIKEKSNLDKNTHFIFFKRRNIGLPANEVFERWIQEVNNMPTEPLEAPAPALLTLGNVFSIPTSLGLQDVDVTEDVIGVSTIKLPNGITLVLKPSTPSMDIYKNEVSIQGFRPNQIPLENREAYLAAQVAPEVIMFTGAGPFSKFDIDRFINGKQMDLQFRLNKDNQLISGKSKIQDVPELLNLLYLYLVNPRKDNKAFDVWKGVKIDELKGRGLRGSASFIMDEIAHLWYPQVPTLGIKDLEQFRADQVYEAAQQWFSSIENYTFIITGDFQSESLLPVVVNRLSGFPAKRGALQNLNKNFDFPVAKMRESFEFENIDAAYVRLHFPIKVKRDLKTQIELNLLSRALNERIWDKLREGSYAPNVNGEWWDVENGVYAFIVNFDCTIGEEEKMIAWALEEFRSLKKQGVEKEWLDTAIAEELNRYENGFTSFHYYNFWQDYLQRKMKNDEDLENEVLKYGTILDHFVNLQDINTAANKYISEEHLQQFIGFPEGHQKSN